MNREQSLTGLWRRLAIENPDGSGDTVTEVYWLQAGNLYADIRIPADRPSIPGPERWHEIPEEHLLSLAMQHGFAGEIRFAGGCCTWQRWLDYQPPLSTADEGRLEFNGRMLVEYGTHAPYIEHWWHEDDARDGYVSFTLQGSRPGILLMVGSHFMRAVGRRTPLSNGDSLPLLIRRAAGEEARLAALMGCEISFGRCEGDVGAWTIIRSTLPGLEGRPLFPAGMPEWHADRNCLSEPVNDHAERVWALYESAGSKLTRLFGGARHE